MGPRRLRGVTCLPVPVPGTARGHVRLRTARVAPWTRGRRRLQTGRRVVPPSWGARPTLRTRQTWEEPPVHARRRPTWTLGFRGHLALGATQPERGQKRIPAPGSSRPCGGQVGLGALRERRPAARPTRLSRAVRGGLPGEGGRWGWAARAPGASPATAPRTAGLGSRPALRRGRPRAWGASRGNGSYPHETVVGSLTRRVPHSRACRWTEGAILGAGCCGGSREQTGGEQAHRRVEGAAGAGRAARPSSLCWKRQHDEPVAPSLCSRAVTGVCDESTAEARASCRCRYSPYPNVRPGCGPQGPAA